jgi:hypothetical protein
MRLTYMTDPGHGWLLVTVGQLKELDLDPSDFSAYSYRNGDVLALEEDCDMGKYLDRFEERYRSTPLISAEHVDHDCEIRSWDSL